MTDSDIYTALSRLIPNTKTHKRPNDLIEVATYMDIALKGFKPKELAERLTISTGMINKFLSVFKLPLFIQDLIKERVIDSVALVYDLSKLNSTDLLELLPLLKDSKINSTELKAFLPYRKRYPNQSIVELYNLQINSKNIKVSVIRLNTENIVIDLNKLETRLKEIVKAEDLLRIEINGDFVDIKLTKQGETEIRNFAKNKSLTLQTLIQEIIK